MAHPHESHKAHHVEKERVAHIIRECRARGGGVHHPDEQADRELIHRMVKPAAMKAEGHKAKHRADRLSHRAKGGRVKKPGHVNVNVITGGGHPAPMPVPVPAGAPLMPSAAAAPAMPPHPMGPPALPPGGAGVGPVGMPGMMPRRSGGRAYAKGGAVKSGPAWEEGRNAGTQVQHSDGKNDGGKMYRGKPITYASGGRIEAPQGVAPATKMPGGSGGGEGRLAKAHRAKRG